jgi:hypothetical protein
MKLYSKKKKKKKKKWLKKKKINNINKFSKNLLLNFKKKKII